MGERTDKHTYRKRTPKELESDQRVRELIEEEKPEIKKRAQAAHEKAMKTGLRPRTAILALLHERKRQGLSIEEMNVRSGIDCVSAAGLEERDSDPTIKTLEGYAEALGKKLLIVLADD